MSVLSDAVHDTNARWVAPSARTMTEDTAFGGFVAKAAAKPG